MQDFKPEEEWVVGPGDLLYLPPHYAHYGIALDDCITYSIGFRAPSAQEMATQFLVYLQDQIQLTGMYQDPDLTVQTHPAEISRKMTRQITAMLKQIRWNQNDVIQFLGQYLSEPKQHIFFEQPDPPLSQHRFKTRFSTRGLQLALQSQLLFKDNLLFMNGEKFQVSPTSMSSLIKLADNRRLLASEPVENATLDLLYQWYLNGYIELN